MAENPIPDDVLSFIDRTITSIDQLEILLLLRAQRDRTWTGNQVSDELRSHPTAAAERLESLATAGLIESDGQTPAGYRFRPASPEMGRLVDGLDQSYRAYRLRVIERVFKKPDSFQSFADAFRIRKDKR